MNKFPIQAVIRHHTINKQHTYSRYKNRLWVLCLVATFLLCPRLKAQYRTTLLWGIGRTNIYDTYLSPLNYRGPNLSFSADIQRQRKKNAAVSFNSLTRINLGYTQNHVQTAQMYDFRISTDLGWSYAWTNILPNTSVSAGALWGITLGVTYNSQNGNNPAQGHTVTRLSAAISATYSLPLHRKILSLRYQAFTPLLGMMFSPQFGQSYYSIFSQGNWDRNLVATHPLNALSLYHRLTLHIPCNKRTLSLGYEGQITQAKPNYLRQHYFVHSFVIGWSLGK